MGSCCSKSKAKPEQEDRLPSQLNDDKDIPDLHPAVYIELAIPCSPPKLIPAPSSEASVSSAGDVRWENVINYDNIITGFSKHTGVLTQLRVRQDDSLYFKRLGKSDDQPKPVITVTISDPEKGGWKCNLKETLFTVIDTEFGHDMYEIRIICPPSPKPKQK